MSEELLRIAVDGPGGESVAGAVAARGGDGGDDYEFRVLQSLRRIMRSVSGYSRRLNAESHVTTPQLICLHALRRSGAVTFGQLARAVDISVSTATGIMDRLEDKGLVKRKRSNADRRKVYLELTAAGAAVVTRSPSLLQDRLVAGLARLPESDRAGIAEALERVVSLMDAESLDASPHLVGEETFAHPKETDAQPDK